MPALGVLLLSLAATAVVLAAPLELAGGTLLGCWLLVPGTLGVPHGPHLLYIDRLVLVAFTLRLLLRAGRPGEPTWAAFRVTPVHLALGALLLVGWTDGVILAPAQVSLASDLHGWLDLLDLALLFVAVLALARTLGAPRVVHLVVLAATASLVVAGAERLFLHGGWSHFLFEHLPRQYGAPGSFPLALRGSSVRVQAAAQFSLEYGWILALLLPLGIVVGLGRTGSGPGGGPRGQLARRGRPDRPLRPERLRVLLPLALVGVLLLTASRSAEIGMAVGAVLLAAATADRRIVRAVAVAAGAGLALILMVPGLVGSPFATAAKTNSVTVRLDRLPDVFALVAHRPFTGLGFAGVHLTLSGLDNSYALIYGTLGVLGLLAWLGLILTVVAAAAPALRAPRGSGTRNLGAALGVGAALVLGAAASYDATVTSQTTWALMVLGALGVAVAETAPRPAPRPRRARSARLLLPVLGVAVGALSLARAPVSYSQDYQVDTIAPWVVSYSGGYIDDYTGKVLVTSLCQMVTAPSRIRPGTAVRCIRADDIVSTSWDGQADVEVRGPTGPAVAAEARTALGVPLPLLISPTGPPQSGKPAWATTAPVWAGSVGLALALLVPSRRRRRPAEPPEPVGEPDPLPPVLEAVGV